MERRRTFIPCLNVSCVFSWSRQTSNPAQTMKFLSVSLNDDWTWHVEKRIHLKGDFRMSVNTVVNFLRLLVLQALERSLERYVKQLIVNEPHYIIEYCDIFQDVYTLYSLPRRCLFNSSDVYLLIFHYLKLSNLNRRIQCFEPRPPCSKLSSIVSTLRRRAFS